MELRAPLLATPNEEIVPLVATRTITPPVMALCMIISLVACVRSKTQSSGPRASAAPGARPSGGLPAAVQRELSSLSSGLGPSYELARYGAPNPACWTAQTAPVKVKRRLTGAIESGAAWDTQLCLAEYVRRGTHDDLLFKVFVFSDPTVSSRLLGAPYFQRKAAQLQTARYPRIETAPRLLFYITGSPSNVQAAWQVMPHWSARLRGAASGHR